jgi:hypothetical protein
VDELQGKLDDIRRTLWDEANALLDLRDALWAEGKPEAAMAVDEARNGIYRARHDLKRAYPKSD